MRIFLAGGVSGNLNPAWKYAAKQGVSDDNFIQGLIHENFWRGGESRHWLHSEVSPIKENELGEECNYSWQGSLHGGVGGGTTR